MCDEVLQCDEIETLQCVLTPEELQLSQTPGSMLWRLAIPCASGAVETLSSIPVEVDIRLPHSYPSAGKPSAFVRSKDTRLAEDGINGAVRNFLSEAQTGAPVLLELYAFLIENVPSYIKETCESAKHEVDRKIEDVAKKVRWTIYSHHIYNQTKRRAIQQEARENDLVGFCLTGKPGVIVIEGLDDACRRFWSTIHSMTWQRIEVRHREELPNDYTSSFDKFIELGTSDVAAKSARSFDMGQFRQYLCNHNVEHLFSILFGVGAT